MLSLKWLVNRQAVHTARFLEPRGICRFFLTTFRMASAAPAGIAAPPAADQHILHNGQEYTTIKEGLAHILLPASASKTPQTKPQGDNQAQSVFYNPIQQFNRDLSVLVIKTYGEEVVMRKRRNEEQRFIAKRKDKKRKREEDGLSDTARKAGKLQDSACVPSEDLDAADTAEPAYNNLIIGEEKDHGTGEKYQPVRPSSKIESENQQTGVEAGALPDTTGELLQHSHAAHDPTPAATLRPPTFTILDALSATGLRALRYAKEIPFTTSITANDLLPTAAKAIKLNVKHNNLEDKIKTVTGNALTHMYSLVGENCRDDKGRHVNSAKYDVIDLDPYGTAVPFLDAAVQSVRDDGGLLCVTCTDAAVWASNGYPEKAYSLYGGVSVKGMHSHEGGLRLILHAIATSAARYGLAMEPLLSLSIDFYARVFVRLHKSAADVKFLAGKTMIVWNCDIGCGSWETQMVARNKLEQNKKGSGYFWKHGLALGPSAKENCRHCGRKTHMAGPMYGGPIQSPQFIKSVLEQLPKVSKETYQTMDRVEGMLTVALEETLAPLENDQTSPTSSGKTGRYDPTVIDRYPFFFIPSVLAKVIHCVTPHENALRGAFRHLGYRVTRSHTKGGSIKTDAPWEVIWEVMREWVRQKAPVREGSIRVGTAGYSIMGFDKLKNSVEPQESDATNGDGAANGQRDDVNVDVAKKGRLEVVFDEQLGMDKDARKLMRYQQNPRENWGPMNRAKGPG